MNLGYRIKDINASLSFEQGTHCSELAAFDLKKSIERLLQFRQR